MKSYPFAKLSVTGFPTVADLNNEWIFPLDVKAIVNVSGHDYPKEIASVLNSRSVKTYSLPLVEEGPDMGLENILSAIRVLKEADAGYFIVSVETTAAVPLQKHSAMQRVSCG